MTDQHHVAGIIALRVFGAFLLTVTASACSLNGPKRADSAPAAEDLVARDFVHVLAQLDGYTPQTTTVRILDGDSDDHFISAMERRLRDEGYAIRRVGEQAGHNLLQYRLNSAPPIADARSRDTYELAVGAVQMRREYSVRRGGDVSPLSPLYVRGVDASAISLDHSIFGDGEDGAGRGGNRKAPRVDTRSVSRPQPKTTPVQRPETGTLARTFPTKPRPVVADRTASTPVVSRSEQTTTPSRTPRLPGELLPATSGQYATSPSLAALRVSDANVFDLGSSNFTSVFSDYANVDESILVFGNDSLRLGRANKDLIEKMVKRFEASSDLFSVVGCSLGSTKVAGGNAALALGRAGRVREALMFAGVKPDHILDEGCWAGSPEANALPRRGVVLTLKRRKS